MENNKFIKGKGVYYFGLINSIKKSTDYLKPVYEAFTNSLESIKLKDKLSNNGIIKISLNLISTLTSNTDKQYSFDSLSIEDNGIGFDDTEFERFTNINDSRKGFKNKGTGRVQFLHFFHHTYFKSNYLINSENPVMMQREFVFSKSYSYLENNSIIKLINSSEIENQELFTELIFKEPIDEKDIKFYSELNLENLKEKILDRYLDYFCENIEILPKIIFYKTINNKIVEEMEIQKSDITIADKEIEFDISLSKSTSDSKNIITSSKKEKLKLKCYKIPVDKLSKNLLKITVKNEIAQQLKLSILAPEESIQGIRYLFLLSGHYIDNLEPDLRGSFKICTKEEFKNKFGNENELFESEELILENLLDAINNLIENTYPEITIKKEEKQKEIEKLQKLFLLDINSIRNANIKLTDSDEDILTKIYKEDAKLSAQKDAKIYERINALNNLNPQSKDFQDNFINEIEELTKAIPLQNKIQLTKYVARRQLVLELFQKILDRKLDIQQFNNRNFDESIIHNLLFRKGSENPNESDLWLINEDFIYYNGVSEHKLNLIEINNEKLFKDEFSEEETRYLNSLGEKRLHKRPDVLLFPEEGKCIIIEFKSPTVNVADHLNQIDFYANLIRNYTVDNIQIKTFYGYLIGEEIETRDVLGRVSRYEKSYQFDYFFRPSENVIGFNDRSNGSIYTEVIKYSTLLDRAIQRNKIFRDKLFS